MLKQGLQQKLQQKLSPQQIQFIKLLQLSTVDFLQRVDLEMIENPALLSAKDEDSMPSDDPKAETESTTEIEEDRSIDDYMMDEAYDVKEYVNDEYEPDGFHLSDEGDEERKETPITETESFHQHVQEQFNSIAEDDKELVIGTQIMLSASKGSPNSLRYRKS
jgi:RNA polymerase sigma-54 factor